MMLLFRSLDLGNMPSDHAPRLPSLACPHPGVSVHTTDESAADVDLHPRPQGGNHDLLAHGTRAQLLGLVLSDPNRSARVTREVRRLRA